jgi:hypothetical protein
MSGKQMCQCGGHYSVRAALCLSFGYLQLLAFENVSVLRDQA